MRITAIVPVRKGSQRVLNKNTRPFAGSNLLQVKLDVLKKLNIDIVVNTDCPECIKIAKKNGIRYHERENYYASSEVLNSKFWKHLGEVTESDAIMMAQVTSPLVKLETYQKAIDSFKDCDSVNSVHKVREFMWKDGKPLNYDANKTPKSQDLPDIVALNFAIGIIDRKVLIEKENVVGYSPRFIEISEMESTDIDTMLDFRFAEYLYKKLVLK